MISIDITDTQIKLVEAVVAGKVSVKRAASRDLPAGCIENGRILDMHIVAGEITDILVSEKIATREAIICINSSMILYREIEIPKPRQGSDTTVVESIIQSEMSLGDEYNITYSISGEIRTDEGPKLKVVAAAAPQSMIDIYLELARQVGLKVKLMAVSNTCITRLVRGSSVYKAFSPLLVLQIDRNFININLYDRGQVLFSRHTMIEASDYEKGSDYINLAVFDNLFRTMHLIEQNNLAGQGQITEVQYFGQVRSVNALASTVKQLNLGIREFEFPTDLVRSRRNFEFLEYANVIGSLLKVDEKTENINLLNTREQRAKVQNTRFGLVALLTAGLCLLVVFGTWFAMNYIKGTKEDTLAQNQKTYEGLYFNETSAYIGEMEEAMEILDRYSERVDTAWSLYHFQPRMTRQIAEKLKAEFIEDMSILGEFEVDEYVLKVEFHCSKPNHPQDYYDKLVAAGYFEDIRYYGYENYYPAHEGAEVSFSSLLEAPEPDGFTFELQLRIKGGNHFEP